MAGNIVANLSAANPGATVTVRDLGANPHPVLDEAALGALFTPADQRTPEQAARVALDDALIAEVQAADVIVIGAPMYNFGMPIQLKAWFDAIARAGVTFRYTANGPEGLLKNKKVFVATVPRRHLPGRRRPAGAAHAHVAELPGHDRRTVHVLEGLGMGPEAAAKGQAEADAAVAALA